MHMKYFQAIADIRNHYDEMLKYFEEPRWGHLMLEARGIELSEKELLIEEREVLRYLIGCQHCFVREKNATKPSLDVVQRCFKRQLSYLERIHGCHAYNVNKHTNKLIQKNYKACRHYLFKFSLPAWYAKLPEEILTIENKYSRL
ncbi:hypothetical protein [Paenibacillus polymyxa]|uniref:Uncharacterized protein n=1 Tax=Paenibacillus polymyxa (strain SC2) TaxID=886882 RepID=E3EJU9_PAEPS|nr:hypothetical protein [Paenibacillus polymyxa]ADO59697.1 hypothetical protein PPSC2_26650 [Paenibacillus polymyxa SC2]WPQ59481.1 hypothetical protein SKN87_27855 [Paenibacillus polymyxa]